MNSAINIMAQICSYLKQTSFNLSSDNTDGRIDSIKNEYEVLQRIEKSPNFNIKIPSSRSWADFFIDGIPVNIKITTTKTADNAGSKEGIYYTLTGLAYQGSNDWEHYLHLLKDNIKKTDKDYYFLVINKTDLNDIFFNSLRYINTLVPNGNNLPFQIKWADNRDLIRRDFNNSKWLLLNTLGKSLQLRSKAYDSFKQYFNEYID